MNVPKLPKLLLLGHATHGKDTVGEMLSHYGFDCASSSWACAELVMMPYFASIGQPYPDAGTCFEDRVNHRATWFDQISKYNREGAWSRLSLEILRDHDVYMGMRNRTEFEASKSLYDYIVWIDASKRLPPEPDSSMELTEADADWTIDNNRSLNGLSLQVLQFLKLIGVRTTDTEGES